MAVDPAALAAPSSRSGIQSVAGHLTLLAASAVPLALAFPEPGWGWLAHVALVPMTVLAIRSASAKRLAWTSYLVFLAWWLIRTSWLIGVIAPGWFALAAYMAMYTPLTLLLVRWLVRRFKSAAVLALPLAWVSLEFIRAHFLQGGFAWFVLGHSQAPYAPEHGVSRIIQIADLFGQYGVSFLVCMTNGLIVDLLSRPLVRRAQGAFRPSGAAPGAGGAARRPGQVVLASLILWLGATAAAWLYGQYRLTQTLDRGSVPPPLRVAVVQTNVPQDNKDSGSADQVVSDWFKLVDLTQEAAAKADGPELIVWPETVVPAALNPEALTHYRTAGNGNEAFHEQIGALSLATRAYLLAGASAGSDWRPYTMEGRELVLPALRYNSAYLYTPQGEQGRERYDKIHRVPFGEYTPWVENWPAAKRWFMRVFSPYGDYDYTIRPGQSYTIFHVFGAPAPASGPGPATAPGAEGTGSAATQPARGAQGPVRVATPICFEDAQPSVVRRMVYGSGAQKRADLLVNLTNDGWYPGTDQGPQHMQIAVFRSVENRVPTARSVNTGVSGFIDSAGRVGPVVEKNGRRQEVDGSAQALVAFDPRSTLFGRIGNAPVYAIMVITAALALLGLRRRTPAARTGD